MQKYNSPLDFLHASFSSWTYGSITKPKAGVDAVVFQVMWGKGPRVVWVSWGKRWGGGERGRSALGGVSSRLVFQVCSLKKGKNLVQGLVGMLLFYRSWSRSHFMLREFFLFCTFLAFSRWFFFACPESCGGPCTGWGSSLCCWLGWDTARYGDDCASYCLASAGVVLQLKNVMRVSGNPSS